MPKNESRKIPKTYIPDTLTNRNAVKQRRNIKKSRKKYKIGEYFIRPNITSFVSKPSNHVENAKKRYNVASMVPDIVLSKRTGCSIEGLKKIINKGRGAYFSSGSRPNQTPQSWGSARLASSITGAKASIADYHILESECKKNSVALLLAKRAKKTYKSLNNIDSRKQIQYA